MTTNQNSTMERDTEAMMALRGLARHRLVAGIPYEKVVFDLVREARGEWVSDKQVQKIVGDLKDEGLIPSED